jgi:hypothetical protein
MLTPERVYVNNGFAASLHDGDDHGRSGENQQLEQSDSQRAGRASSRIKHVIFVNKENATHD